MPLEGLEDNLPNSVIEICMLPKPKMLFQFTVGRNKYYLFLFFCKFYTSFVGEVLFSEITVLCNPHLNSPKGHMCWTSCFGKVAVVKL